MTKDALRALAAQAVTKGTGARALRSMIERLMLDIMYEIPSREGVADVTINRAVVEGKRQPLIRRKQEKDAAGRRRGGGQSNNQTGRQSEGAPFLRRPF